MGYNEPDVLIRKHLLGETITPRFHYDSGVVMRTIAEHLIERSDGGRMMDCVVVTGAGGIVGRSAVARLSKSGWRVIPIVSPTLFCRRLWGSRSGSDTRLAGCGPFSHVVHLAVH